MGRWSGWDRWNGCGGGARFRAFVVVLAIGFTAALSAEESEAQSTGLGWLKDIEQWTAQEDYRTWIGHGMVAAASTLFGHFAFEKAHYGAGAAVMFYAGVEYQELRRDRWVVKNKLDKFMDIAVPVTVGALLVTLLSDDEPRGAVPRPVPPFEPDEDALQPLPIRSASLDLVPGDLAFLPPLPLYRSAR